MSHTVTTATPPHGLQRLTRTYVQFSTFTMPWWGWVAAVVMVAMDATIYLGLNDVLPLRIADSYPVPSLLAAPALIAALGSQLRPARRLWWLYLASFAAVTVLGFVIAPAYGGIDAFGIVIAATSEEFSYRLAVPLVLVALLGRVLPVRTAVPVALALASLYFALAPGHLAQVPSLWMAIPFIATGWLWSVVVWMTGQVALTSLFHAAMNLTTAAVLALPALLPAGAYPAAVLATTAGSFVAVVLCARRTTTARAELVPFSSQ